MLAMFTLMEPGASFVAANKLYGGSVTQFMRTFQKFGWDCEMVDVDDFAAVEAALKKSTVKALFCESLANPGGVISDLEPLAELAHAAGVPLIVDNTMASPALCRPFEWGADIVIHSTTKFISGHGNAMGGMVVDSGKFNWAQNDKFPSLTKPEPAYHGLNFFEPSATWR